MRERYGAGLKLRILKADGPETRPFNFRSATNLVVNGEVIPIATGNDEATMAALLREKLWMR